MQFSLVNLPIAVLVHGVKYAPKLFISALNEGFKFCSFVRTLQTFDDISNCYPQTE